MKKFNLLFVGLLLSFNSQSQLSQLTDSIMNGGKIQAYAKNSSACVIVATEGGLFKTLNQGQSWTNVTQTFDPYTVNCKNIASLGNDFYAISNNNNGSNQLYKTTDNGANWTTIPISSFSPQSIGKISTTLYALGGNNNGGYVYTSTDGSSWTQKAMIYGNSGQNGNFELLSFNQSKIYIAYNNNLYFTSDGNTIDTVKTTGLGNSGINTGDNNIDGDALGNLYYRGGIALYKYNFTTKVWSDISTSQLAVGFQPMQFSATDNAVFVIGMNATLGMRLYKSVNQGSTFTELTTTGLSLPMIGNIIEVSANNFIGNWLDDRILISSNGGISWSSSSANQYIATSAANLVRSGNTLLYSREVKGLILSNNQGLNWTASNNGIPGFGGIAYFVDQIIAVKDTLFSFCRPDPYTQEVALYKSSNAGASWNPAPIPPPYGNVAEYTFAGKCDSALFVNFLDTSNSTYALLVSFNYGSSWTKPNSTNSSYPMYLKGIRNCLFSFYAPSNNSWEDFSNVWKANNYGQSFTDINTGGLFNYNFLIKRLLDDRGDKTGAMMDVDPINNKAVFVVRDRTMGNGKDKLFVYNISTTIWSEILTTGLPLNYQANSIRYNGSNLWLLATNSGLYKSSNNGADWTLAYTSGVWQNGIVVNSIQLIGSKVFMGSLANGIWVVDLAVGILEQLKENDLQIYPNPTADVINIVIPDYNGKTARIVLYAFDGKEIMNKSVKDSQFQLDLHGLASGSYFVVVHSNNATYKKMIIRK